MLYAIGKMLINWIKCRVFLPIFSSNLNFASWACQRMHRKHFPPWSSVTKRVTSCTELVWGYLIPGILGEAAKGRGCCSSCCTEQKAPLWVNVPLSCQVSYSQRGKEILLTSFVLSETTNIITLIIRLLCSFDETVLVENRCDLEASTLEFESLFWLISLWSWAKNLLHLQLSQQQQFHAFLLQRLK